MSVIYLNAQAPMTFGKICTLHPGKNELSKEIADALNKTKIAKYLRDNEILSERERNPDRVYTPPALDPEKLIAVSGTRSAKPLGKDGKSAMTPDSSISIPVGELPDDK